MESKGSAHIILADEPRTKDVRLKSVMPFSKMLLSEEVRKGLHRAGFVYPTVLQATAIPVGKSGMDLLVQSKSGTGKTVIFCSIALELYRPDVSAPQSLIVAPTREVAVQIELVLNEIGSYCPKFKAVCVIGGLDVADDRKRLQGAKAVVGTPGRIVHLVQNQVLNTSKIKLLVLDEADKMYSHSFRQSLKTICSSLPSRRQTIACSATFANKLDEELAKTMRKPLLVSEEERSTLLVGIKQFAYQLPEQKTSILEMQLKLEGLRHIFRRVSFKQCIIFAGSQSRAESYCNYLEKEGWPCELISGAQEQVKRLEQFRKFRDFKIRILVATDLMSRGIDSEYVNLVINLELPTDTVTYLHRIGRAGRFGSHGLAINFIASEKDRKCFDKLITEVGTGMNVLLFPKETNESKERNLWDFSSSEEDAKAFGLYVTKGAHAAPLASYDDVSLTPSVTENGHAEIESNPSLLDQSSISTTTFLINSKDSAVNIPNEPVSVPMCKAPQRLSPAPNASEHPNTPCESQNTSSHQLITSNTIDDASSIAADSLHSSQQDISRYRSVLMQKSAIPTLVEFLVDQQPSEEKCTEKPDLFSAYRDEVLNATSDTSEKEVTVCAPSLNLSKLEQLKTLLIDKPTPKSPANDNIDMYLDFVNAQEKDLSDSASNDLDKQTFILSATTPSLRRDSLEELQNNSSASFPSSRGPRTATESLSVAENVKHFPSPAPNCAPKLPGFIADASPELRQPKLSMSAVSQMNIPPYQSPPNSVSPLANAVEQVEEDSPARSEQSIGNFSNDEASATESEHNSGNSSGFNENTSSSGSSGIESSDTDEADGQLPGLMAQNNIIDDENDNDSSSEHYSDSDDSDDDTETPGKAAHTSDGKPRYEQFFTGFPFPPRVSAGTAHGSNASNSQGASNTDAYERWYELYRNQIKMIQDYVQFCSNARQRLN